MRHLLSCAARLAPAIALAALAGGCQAISPAPPRPVATATPPSSPKPVVADRIVVEKRRRVLELLHDGEVFETFSIALGLHPIGPKRQEGDDRTPEGVYRIDWKSTHTRWSRELHISYPNARDRAWAAEHHVDPGGAIFIHGMPRDYGPYDPPFWVRDWTEGCIAVGNAAIVKIWDAVPDGTPIDIEP